MAEYNPSEPTPSAAKTRAMRCEDWECLIAEALDGTLSTGDSAAFERHAHECSGCAQMLEKARQGAAWLDLLKTGPEVPPELLGRILAQTGGAAAAPALRTNAVRANAGVADPWRRAWPLAANRALESRLLMTAAMAFFSIALTLNLTRGQLSEMRLSDLQPETLQSTLTRQYYSVSEGVAKYYENLPLVYEVQAGMRDLWRSAKPQQAAGTPVAPRGSSRGSGA
jgi:Putative zinc-finger